MRNVLVPNPTQDNLTQQLISLYRTFQGATLLEPLALNMDKVRWACPFLLLPLSAYIAKTGSVCSYDGAPEKTRSYLQAVSFPNGVNTVSALQSKKSFIPIGVLKRNAAPQRERLETAFSEMVYGATTSIAGARSAIYYPIAELVTNVFEHSKEDIGFIFGQFYETKQHLDICIVDCGQGLAASYKKEKNLDLTDERAIAEVMKGHSTKANSERGYGVRTSKKLVAQGLGGSFVIVSGSSALIADKAEEHLISLPRFYWQGTIVAYRIPKPTKIIDIYQYLE